MSWDYNIGTMAFPGGLVVRILDFHCHDSGSMPGWGTNLLQAKKRKIIDPEAVP